MFDFFEKKEYVKPKESKKEESAKEKIGRTFYRLGITDNNRVSLSMGYTEISMDRDGCQQLIDNITFFMNQIKEEKDDTAR